MAGCRQGRPANVWGSPQELNLGPLISYITQNLDVLSFPPLLTVCFHVQLQTHLMLNHLFQNGGVFIYGTTAHVEPCPPLY
jgi:hypothetical protein